MTMIQPQPQPQPQPPHDLEALLLKRIREVELPAYIAAGLIVRSVCENWTDAKLKSERFRAKWVLFFERMRQDVEAEVKPGAEEEIRMLRDGEDGEC